uniref:Putative secreted protein n=1 Tax=Ixodes ricinus TaxID=34613 RepID=A0A6B0U184_IXORI
MLWARPLALLYPTTRTMSVMVCLGKIHKKKEMCRVHVPFGKRLRGSSKVNTERNIVELCEQAIKLEETEESKIIGSPEPRLSSYSNVISR